ncbi:MAG: chitobiase/beta-hexosaminidase C-terminal domain-containing protein [bacterium]|nr:chitobiase/beta-hexosaminidase C-terminal domain-containing protein [bacterium]
MNLSKRTVLQITTVVAAAVFLWLAPLPAVAQEVPLTPAPGEYPDSIEVRFETDPSRQVYFTLDGSEPSMGSAVFKDPIRVADNTVIRYFVVYRDGSRGSVQEAFYRIRMKSPSADELRTVAHPPGGIYNQKVRVSLSTREDATIYFTMDGSDPSTDSDIYRTSLSIAVDTRLKFFAVDRDGSREPIREESYMFRLADRLVDTTPPKASVSPLPANYRSGDLLRLFADEEADIYYSLDGSDPTEMSQLYEGPFWLTESTRLKFLAIDRGGNRSRVYDEFYRLDQEPPLSEAYPGTGFYTPPLTVRITVSDEEAIVFYTLNGTEPGEQSPVYKDPLVLRNDTVLKFFSSDQSGNSEDVHEETYLFDDEAPVTVADPLGGEYPPPIRVTLRTEEGARIHYTLDGYDPDTESPTYFSGFTFIRPTTLKFFSIDRTGNMERIQTHRYTLVNGVWRKYARGVFLLPSVTDGKTFWMGTESGLALYRVGSGDRSFVGDTEGLLGTVVNDMVIDEAGDLWAATDEGLNRFREGEGFVTFTRDEGLPAREVLGLGVDRDGSIWAGTEKGVVRIKDGAVREKLTAKDGLPGETVLCIAVDYAGNRWFGTRKGLAKYTPAREWHIFTKESGMVDDEIRTVAVDSDWNTWVGTPKGVSVYDREKWKTYTKEDGIPGTGIVLIAPDPDGEVWIATRTGVTRYSDGKWIVETPP